MEEHILVVADSQEEAAAELSYLHDLVKSHVSSSPQIAFSGLRDDLAHHAKKDSFSCLTLSGTDMAVAMGFPRFSAGEQSTIPEDVGQASFLDLGQTPQIIQHELEQPQARDAGDEVLVPDSGEPERILVCNSASVQPTPVIIEETQQIEQNESIQPINIDEIPLSIPDHFDEEGSMLPLTGVVCASQRPGAAPIQQQLNEQSSSGEILVPESEQDEDVLENDGFKRPLTPVMANASKPILETPILIDSNPAARTTPVLTSADTVAPATGGSALPNTRESAGGAMPSELLDALDFGIPTGQIRGRSLSGAHSSSLRRTNSEPRLTPMAPNHSPTATIEAAVNDTPILLKNIEHARPSETSMFVDQTCDSIDLGEDAELSTEDEDLRDADRPAPSTKSHLNLNYEPSQVMDFQSFAQRPPFYSDVGSLNTANGEEENDESRHIEDSFKLPPEEPTTKQAENASNSINLLEQFVARTSSAKLQLWKTQSPAVSKAQQGPTSKLNTAMEVDNAANEETQDIAMAEEPAISMESDVPTENQKTPPVKASCQSSLWKPVTVSTIDVEFEKDERDETQDWILPARRDDPATLSGSRKRPIEVLNRDEEQEQKPPVKLIKIDEEDSQPVRRVTSRPVKKNTHIVESPTPEPQVESVVQTVEVDASVNVDEFPKSGPSNGAILWPKVALMTKPIPDDPVHEVKSSQNSDELPIVQSSSWFHRPTSPRTIPRSQNLSKLSSPTRSRTNSVNSNANSTTMNLAKPAPKRNRVMFRSFSKGERVWASWGDGYYYSGIVSEIRGVKYSVSFADGTCLRDVAVDVLLPFILEVGDTVMCKGCPGMMNGSYVSSLVSAKLEETRYLVLSIENLNENVMWVAAFGDLSMSPGDLERRHMKERLVNENAPIIIDDAEEDDAIILDEKSFLTPMMNPVVATVKVEKNVEPFTNNEPITQRERKTSRRGHFSLTSSPHQESPRVSSTSKLQKIFADAEFLFTAVDEAQMKALKPKIQESGGLILDVDDFDPTKHKRHSKQRFLVASKMCRTVKYFLALADGIPRVSIEWIQECLAKDAWIDYEEFLLPNGTDSDGHTVEHKIVSDLLINLTIHLHGVPTRERDTWNRVLRAAGAKVAPKKTSKLDYIVTFQDSPDDLTDCIKPVLQKEWLCQTLIRQQRLETDPYLQTQSLGSSPVPTRKSSTTTSTSHALKRKSTRRKK